MSEKQCDWLRGFTVGIFFCLLLSTAMEMFFLPTLPDKIPWVEYPRWNKIGKG